MMDNYVRLYSDIAPKEWCDAQIEKFEEDKENHETQNCGEDATLTQINMMHGPNTMWRESINVLINYLMMGVEQYKKDCGLTDKQWPTSIGFEPPKLKRYMPGANEKFPDHVDVLNKATCNRFLVAFLYLNTVELGGQTIIRPSTPEVTDSFISTPKQGNLLLFPPMWPWLHTGDAPITGPKYIIGGYLTYA